MLCIQDIVILDVVSDGGGMFTFLGAFSGANNVIVVHSHSQLPFSTPKPLYPLLHNTFINLPPISLFKSSSHPIFGSNFDKLILS